MSNALEHNTPVAALVSTSVGFAMMCVSMSMAILDVQVVATSLPTIQSALDIPPNQMSWVQTAYLIAEVVAMAVVQRSEARHI
jgi:DHA2 family multidrug resistance protein